MKAARGLWRVAAGAAAVSGAAWLAGVWPFEPGPVFWESAARDGSVRTYGCVTPDGATVTVRFAYRGRTAMVEAGGHDLRMTFDGRGLLSDRYQGSGWKLTLDPEANLTGPGGQRFTNCS